MAQIWCTAFGLLVILWLIVGYYYGPRTAVGATAIASLLVPRWIKMDAIGTEVDVPVGAGIAALSLYCLHRKSEFRTKLNSVDFAMIALIASHIASDTNSEGFNVLHVLKAYGEWFVPYVLGRIAVKTWQDVRLLSLAIAMMCTLSSLQGIIESIFRTNLYELVVLERSPDIAKYVDRFGFRRAFGQTENPIYFGSMLLILLPWTIEYARSSIVEKGKWPAAALPGIGFAGVLSSVSRAPILGSLILAIGSLYYCSSRALRAILMLTILGIVGILTAYSDSAIENLHVIGEDVAQHQRQKLLIGGEKVEYSSTSHRLHLFRIFDSALKQAGLLGYGSERTSVFPPRVPYSGNNDVEAIQKLWCVDNQFILTCLRFGYVGLISWICILLFATQKMWLLAYQADRREGLFYSLMMAMLVAMILIQFTVWMPHDYGFLLVWSCGAIAGRWAGFKTTRS